MERTTEVHQEDRWTATERHELFTGRASRAAGSRLRPALVRLAGTANGELFLTRAGVDVDRLHRLGIRRTTD